MQPDEINGVISCQTSRRDMDISLIGFYLIAHIEIKKLKFEEFKFTYIHINKVKTKNKCVGVRLSTCSIEIILIRRNY